MFLVIFWAASLFRFFLFELCKPIHVFAEKALMEERGKRQWESEEGMQEKKKMKIAKKNAKKKEEVKKDGNERESKKKRGPKMMRNGRNERKK